MADDLTDKNLEAAMEKIHQFAREWEDSFMIHGTGNPYGLHTLLEARREVAIMRVQLAASWEREKLQDATIRELRRELLECRDKMGRDHCDLDDAASVKSVPDWTRIVVSDRRMMGG
jgi:hypothetical protein